MYIIQSVKKRNMPRSRPNIGRRGRHNQNETNRRQHRAADQHEIENERIAIINTQARAAQTEEVRTETRQQLRTRMRIIRSQHIPTESRRQEQYEDEIAIVNTRARTAQTREAILARTRSRRTQQMDANRALHLTADRTIARVRRAFTATTFLRHAFHYDPEIDYSSHSKINIGAMDKKCRYCNALKFKHETPGMCCASGKVVLTALNPPPEPLKSLMLGDTQESRLFLSKIRKFNSCFQMSSFGATKIVTHNYETTFKVQGQIYHNYGSLMPMPNDDPKFLQIYFLGNEDDQVQLRCHYNHIEAIQERAIVSSLRTFLLQKNQLIRVFKQASTRMHSDNNMIVIKADKVPVGQHRGRFNAPTINDVAIVMVGERFEPRDIRIVRRNNEVETIQDTHRSYDALQYPLIFWEGEDGYHINYKQRNSSTGKYYSTI